MFYAGMSYWNWIQQLRFIDEDDNVVIHNPLSEVLTIEDIHETPVSG